MRIKNIRQYRTYYKEEVRDLHNRNEHQMRPFRLNGSGKREFGRFEVYHGDKEGFGKDELHGGLVILLAKNDYPPVDRDEVYKEIFEQAENFKKYNN